MISDLIHLIIFIIICFAQVTAIDIFAAPKLASPGNKFYINQPFMLSALDVDPKNISWTLPADCRLINYETATVEALCRTTGVHEISVSQGTVNGSLFVTLADSLSCISWDWRTLQPGPSYQIGSNVTIMLQVKPSSSNIVCTWILLGLNV